MAAFASRNLRNLPSVCDFTRFYEERITYGAVQLASLSDIHVLVVDDNVDAAQMVVESLHMLGHEALATYDGPSALGVASSMRPDIALLDIGLPVMDGYELAQRLRAELAPIPRMIALTGYGQETDRERSREAGFDLHLVKPVDLDQITTSVAELSSR